MFFKRIEFTGFKSFANKTTFDLQPGVTLVVGPNGCGKSNILDGIKWVLGNQSPRQMRGKKMLDVIFSGSGAFKPLGMAQVTLTLDNSARTVDMDYDELQITRRLYRSGDSEYLINKVPCRLKDIHNLFLGTGVGTSSYSILEQGQVDRIINAKPFERRFIFEEAAGISKYKARREEALRKLERTATDLKRLNDLIDEVQRHVNSLKRQAGKAERYRKVSAELRQAEMELLVLRSATLRKQSAELNNQVAELEDRLGTLGADHARAAAEESECHEAADDFNAKLSRRSEELLSVKHEISSIGDRVDYMRKGIEENRSRLAQIQSELTETDERERELGGRREESESRRIEAEEKRQSAERTFDELQREYDALKNDVTETTLRIEQMTSELVGDLGAQAKAENEIRIAEFLITRQKEVREERGDEIARLEQAVEGGKARIEELRTSAAALESQVAEKQAFVTEQTLGHADLHSGIADLTEQLDRTRRELHQGEARLSTLSELKESFEGYLQGVREVMKASAEGKLSGVVEPLANLLTVPENLESALEASLGAHLQDIVVESDEAATHAMEFLVEGKCGRSTFWPLDASGEAAPRNGLENLRQVDGFVGYAPELVQCEERIGPVMNSLLGSTVMVRDFEAARRFAGKSRAYDYVTLEGRVLHTSGSLTAGALVTSGLLSREREIAELTDEVKRLRTRESELSESIESSRAQAGELAGAIEKAKAELHDLQVDSSHASRDLESTRELCGKSAETLQKRQAQDAEIATEIESKSLEIEANRELAEKMKLASADLECRLETEKAEARSQSDDYIARGTRLATARAEIDRADQHLTHLRETTEALARETAALENARRNLREESGRLARSDAGAEQAIVGLLADIERLSELRAELETTIAQDRADSEELGTRLAEVRSRIDRTKRDEDIARSDLHEKQIRLAEFGASLSGLSEQANEKFESGLEEIADALGEVDKNPAEVSSTVGELRTKLDRIGPVNLAALSEFDEQSKRLEFLTTQRDDLTDSKKQIEDSIARIDETTKKLFHETFESVRGHFVEMFRRLFNGGKADLVIEGESDGVDTLLEGGVEIFAQPPGKKLRSLSLMSGGEKAMTAIALLFALFLHKPAPFAILDEIDAPLDDANVERFKDVVAEFALNTQFIIISHNKLTMELADIIYGVTMEQTGVSRLVSVKFEHAERYLETVG